VIRKRIKTGASVNVNITLNAAQAQALDEYRFSVRALTRSEAARAVFRAGLATLAASAPSNREREAAAAALALWDADDASTPPPQADPRS